MFRFYRTQFVILASLLTFAVLSTPAFADKATESLAKANRLLQEGVPVKAIELINTTLKSGNVPSDLVARALLMRAQAQEKLGKYAYALADYNQALWQGLPERDKAEAAQGRDRIMSKLGVGGDSAPQKTASTGSGTSRAASSGSWSTSEIKTTPSEERTGGIGSVFSGIFGGTDASETENPASAARPRAQNVNAVVASRAVRAPVKSSTDNVAISVNNEAAGDYAIQMAALHSESGAIYEVDRIEKRYGEWLGGRTPSITVLGTSDGGTLYKVIAEPFQRGEGVATCELLKTKGLSCMLISR
jgi:hypothetical protein